MKIVYSALDPFQASLICTELEQLGIPAEIFNQHGSSGMGELAMNYPQVWIKRDQDEQRALGFIAQFEKRLKTKDDQLVKCSECCETNPASFEVCWSCEGALN